METIYSTEDAAEAEKFKAHLEKDGIKAQITTSGTWHEVMVSTADAAQGFRTLTHFLKG